MNDTYIGPNSGFPHSGNDTSRAAAQVNGARRESQRARLIRLFSSPTAGYTDEDLGDMMQLDGSSLRPRRWQLVKDGYIRDNGKRRNTRNGLSAVVWEPVLESARS